MKNARKFFQDWVDRQLLETDGELTEREAVKFAIESELDLVPSYAALIYHQREAKYNSVSPIDFLREYVHAKFVAYAAGDKGARGDAIEAIVRFFLKHRFITYSDVMVQEAKKTDITAKAGKIEVGHNGKTFRSAFVPADMDKSEFTERNYMNGAYEIVIYGAFRKDFTEDRIFEKVLKTMRVFTNKYEFPHAIAGRNGLASGWNVAHERATVQYTDALRLRFEDYCKENNVPTLGEWLSE